MLNQYDEKQFQNITALNTRLQHDSMSLEELSNKRVIVLLGTTGCGKSTLANAIIRGVSNLVQSDGRLDV